MLVHRGILEIGRQRKGPSLQPFAPVGLIAYVKLDDQANQFFQDYRLNAQVVVLAKSVIDFGDLPSRRGWRRLEPVNGITAWTNDYSDVLRAILRKKLGSLN